MPGNEALSELYAFGNEMRGCPLSPQEASITEKDLQPQKPLWHEDTRGPRRNHPQNLVLTDAAQRMVHFNVQVGAHARSQRQTKHSAEAVTLLAPECACMVGRLTTSRP